MNNRKFQAECRRLMWRATRRDWWLSLARVVNSMGMYNTAHTMADIAQDALNRDIQEFASLMKAKQDTAARTLRA